MRKKTIQPVFVEIIPDRLEEGVLYICEQYKTAVHKCCCGCGEEIVTPFSPVDWVLRKEGTTVTLRPSIGNWSLACKSHYLISKNRVVWAGGMSQWQIDRVRARDRADKKAYIEMVNLQKEKQTSIIFWIAKFFRTLLRLWKK